jgi:hypothetical protein
LSYVLQLTKKNMIQVLVPILKIKLNFGLVVGNFDVNQQLTID